MEQNINFVQARIRLGHFFTNEQGEEKLDRKFVGTLKKAQADDKYVRSQTLLTVGSGFAEMKTLRKEGVYETLIKEALERSETITVSWELKDAEEQKAMEPVISKLGGSITDLSLLDEGIVASFSINNINDPLFKAKANLAGQYGFDAKVAGYRTVEVNVAPYRIGDSKELTKATILWQDGVTIQEAILLAGRELPASELVVKEVNAEASVADM